MRTACTPALLFFALMATMDAHSIEKTFEFGPGMTGSTSHMRAFAIPTGVNVKVTVTFKRFGPVGSSNDVGVIFDVHAPGPEQEGPLRATQTRAATLSAQQLVVYDGIGDSDGCEREWHVRARHTAKTAPKYAVTGTITVSYNSSAKTVSFDPSNIELPVKVGKGTVVTKKVHIPAGSGLVRFQAEWHTDPLDLMHFNSYHKLTVKLLRNGVAVATNTAYSQHAPTDKTPQSAFNFYISPFGGSSDWKLEITGSSVVDVVDFRINRSGSVASSFTPGCQ